MEQATSEILERLSVELRHLAEQTSLLQDRLSPRGFEGIEIEAFQNLNSLHQTLACLANYAADVASVVPCGCGVEIGDAAARICLAALAGRLRGDDDSVVKMQASEVELF